MHTKPDPCPFCGSEETRFPCMQDETKPDGELVGSAPVLCYSCGKSWREIYTFSHLETKNGYCRIEPKPKNTDPQAPTDKDNITPEEWRQIRSGKIDPQAPTVYEALRQLMAATNENQGFWTESIDNAMQAAEAAIASEKETEAAKRIAVALKSDDNEELRDAVSAFQRLRGIEI